MKAIKKILRVILCLVISILIYVICVMSFAFSPPRPCPGDYPNSKWIYDGNYSKIELTVNDDNSISARIITSEGEKDLEITIRSKPQFIDICAKEDDNDDWYSVTVFSGSYRCDDKRMIMSSSSYSPEWRMEDSELRIASLEFTPLECNEMRESIELEFVRVE